MSTLEARYEARETHHDLEEVNRYLRNAPTVTTNQMGYELMAVAPETPVRHKMCCCDGRS